MSESVKGSKKTTTRSRKKACRVKVERLAKIITFVSVMAVLTMGYFIPLNGYFVGALSTVIWFFAPDLAAYYLEHKYKLKHNFMTYR